jgi:hypothetical protein
VATLSLACLAVGVLLGTAVVEAQQPPGTAMRDDPRVGLAPGWKDAGSAIENLELIGSVERPAGFFDSTSIGNIFLANTDLAFRGDDLFLGNFNGFQIYDISEPASPMLRTAFVCPGGQGDVSVYGNLLFLSVEMPNGRIDCGAQPPAGVASPDRFRGVRVFDISDLASPKQVAAVQTCRGSHTHTLVTDPADDANVYVYVSGTSSVRPAEELEGCSGLPPEEDPNTALFRIEVIQVPVASPQDARIVNAPRIFADAQSGAIGGLWPGGAHGEGTQTTSRTDQCHDITVYPELGLAAGACSGNGILLDISDPANPERIDEVIDPNFAYWHSATFNNEGTKVIFTDEWGGGMAPRCRDTDLPEWGANALFTLADRELEQVGYFKLPAPQTPLENCVAHNGSLIPVPGRDIMAQAWYQGGISVFDFTDAAKPIEIAYFDRGPMSTADPLLGGYWSAYWYNGHIYGSEIGRGLDVFTLQPSEHLSQNEIDAAKLVRFEQFNPQTQPRIVWPADLVVARAYVDQLARRNSVPAERIALLANELDRAERLAGAERHAALTQLAASVAGIQTPDESATRTLRLLGQTLTEMANAQN